MTVRGTELRIDGYLDSAGTIALPDGMALASNLLGHIAKYGAGSRTSSTSTGVITTRRISRPRSRNPPRQSVQGRRGVLGAG
jgi:hypothetical protein